MSELNRSSVEQIQNNNQELLDSSELSWALNEAYNIALTQRPELYDVELTKLPESSALVAAAAPSWRTGEPNHQVRLRVDDLDGVLATYEKTMKEIPGLTEEFATQFDIPASEVTPQLLYVASFIHELGHTSEYKDHAHDPEAHDAEVRREKVAMPLGNVAISKLLKEGTPQQVWFEDNWDAIQTKTGAKDKDDAVRMQHAAYRELTHEHAADMFAVDVINSSPSLRDALINPNALQEMRDWHADQQHMAA